MGFIDKIKEFYFELEDGYYELLDKIDKVIPVYKIIDPIDRVIPSYPLVALLCLLVLVLGLSWGLTAFVQGANASLTVRVLDQEESVLPAILVNVSFPDGKTDSKTTNDFGEAQLTVPKGAKITLTVGGEGYQSQTKEVEVTSAEQTVAITLEKEGAAEGARTRTLRFVNAVGQPVGDELRVEFTCKSPYAKAPDPMTVTGGRATVEEPAGCGQLIVTVTDSTDWQTLSSVAVDQDVKTVYLQGTIIEAGRIIVNVTSKGQPVNGVDVELYKYDDIVANGEVGPIDSTIAYDGQATFNKPQGAYLVKAYDASGGYGEAKSEKIVVRAGETATVSLELANNVKGKISLKILDKASKKPIEGARVTLRYAADDSELKTLESGADGIVAFNISDDVEYRVSVDKDGYVLEKVASARLSAATAEIFLEKCTEAKCGLLIVQVVDEDNIPIGNATVAIYLPETNFVAGYENKVSDANGLAKFAGVKPGLYYAFAFREFGAGRSNDFRFGGGLGQGGVDATVTMQVGNGTLMVYAVNQDNEPIPFTMVDVYSTLTGGKIGSSFTDANGVLSIETKADKEIYVRASKEGYAAYVSASRKISSGGLTRFVALMEPKIIERGAEIRFLGLYKGERVATSLAAGEEYSGRWQLRIPEALPYKQAGIHLRTGDELIMEKDDFYIEGVNAPGAAIVKSTAYDARSGYDQSTYDYTFGDAKWLNAVWSNPKPGIYELEATIQVRKTASVGDELNLYYRSWAVDGVVVRDPADDFIETNELYNNAYKQTYQIGASTLCDQDFCFDVSLRDLEQDVLENVVDTYQAQVFTEYEAVFTLTNNSKSAYHTNANLRIINPDQSLIFLDYTINDADGRPRVGRVNGPEFPRLDIGNLAPNKRVTGKFRFSTQRAINGVINFRLVSDQQIAFDRFINVAVSATKQLNILAERNTFSSGVENDLVFSVVDVTTNLEVPSVTCRLKDRRGNLIARAITDPRGRIVIRMPAQLPGTLLVLECDKEKFDRKEIEINITINIIEVQPAEISITLNAKTKTEAEVVFHVKNLANFPLKIASIELLGDFKNLLDEQQIRNWLVSNYKDFVIQPGQTLDATLRVFLSDDGKALIDRADLNGKLFINVTNFGQEWSFETPARIGIGLTGDVDSPGCLTITRDKWQTTTEGNPVNVEFQIQNNCLINGIPVPLKRLQAQIALQGNQLGEYKLTVGSTEVELRSTYGRTIVGEIGPGETINAILTFTPYGGTLGEAKGDLLLTARNPKEENDQFLETKMNTEIAIINIKDCVSIDRHLVVMPEKGNGTFTISTKKCGGKTTFQLDSDLELSVKEFVLDGDGSQQVQVFAGEELPGQYGVTVKAKAQNENQEQLIRNVRVRVDSLGCLSLSRYEFDVLDQASDPFDGFDNAQLINRCVEKEITVKVDMRDLGEALKEGAIWGAVMLGVGLLGEGFKAIGLAPECKVDTDCSDPNAICRNGKCVAKPATGNPVTLKSNLGTVSGYTNVYLGSDGCQYQVINGQNVALPNTLQPPGCGGVPMGGAPWPAGQPGVASPPVAPGTAPAGGVPPLPATGALFAASAGLGAGVGLVRPLNSGTFQYEAQNGKIYPAKYDSVSNTYFYRCDDCPSNPWLVLMPYYTAQPAASTPVVAAAGAPGPEGGAGALGPTGAPGATPPEGWVDTPIAFKSDKGGEGKLRKVVNGSELFFYETRDSKWYNVKKDNVGYYYLCESCGPPGSPMHVNLNALLVGITALPLVNASSTPTGFLNFGGSQTGTGTSAFGGVGNILGTVVGAATGQYGFIAQALTTFLGVAMATYLGQDEEKPFRTIQTDVEIQDFGLYPNNTPNQTTQDTEVEVTEELGEDGEPVITSAKDPQNKDVRVEKRQFLFNNLTAFTTEPQNPKVKYLIIKATQHNYNEDHVYDIDDFGDDGPENFENDLKEEEATPATQKFRLQFNAVPPEANISYDPALLNCQSGVRTGRTGPQALPKVKLDWTWSAINENDCDTDNAGAVFCDGTQFSIALLKKIRALDQYLQANSPFTCPTALEPFSTKTATIGAKDIGISRLEANRVNNDYNVAIEITNNNPAEVEAQAKAFAIEIVSGKT